MVHRTEHEHILAIVEAAIRYNVWINWIEVQLPYRIFVGCRGMNGFTVITCTPDDWSMYVESCDFAMDVVAERLEGEPWLRSYWEDYQAPIIPINFVAYLENPHIGEEIRRLFTTQGLAYCGWVHVMSEIVFFEPDAYEFSFRFKLTEKGLKAILSNGIRNIVPANMRDKVRFEAEASCEDFDNGILDDVTNGV